MAEFDLTKLLSHFYTKLPTGSSSKRMKTLGMEVPESFSRFIDEVAQSPDFKEYKTKSDVLRDCCYIGLQIRTGMIPSPELEGHRAGLHALSILDRMQERKQMVDELAMRLRTESSGENRESLLAQSTELLKRLPAGSEWDNLQSAIDFVSSRPIS